MKTLYITILSAFLFTFLTTAPNPAWSAEPDRGPGDASSEAYSDPLLKVVATIDDTKITEGMLQIYVQKLIPSMSFHSSVSKRRMKLIRATGLKNLINNMVILHEARELNITVKESDINKKVKALKKKISGKPQLKDQSFKKILKNSGMTVQDLKDDFRDDLIRIKLSNQMKKEFN